MTKMPTRAESSLLRDQSMTNMHATESKSHSVAYAYLSLTAVNDNYAESSYKWVRIGAVNDKYAFGQ